MVKAKSTSPKEDEEQERFCAYLDKMGYRYKATPNGMCAGSGGGRFAYIAKMKRQGLKTGYPDIDIYVKNSKFNMLIIEMKRQEGGVLSPEQKNWLNWLDTNGYCVAVAKGCDAAIRILNKYLGM